MDEARQGRQRGCRCGAVSGAQANQLASVDDVFNAVLVKGDMLGDVVFYGKGAGKLPTASAVVADVVDALKHGSKVHDSLFWQPAEPVEGMLTDPAPAAYYVRVAGIAPAVVEAIYGYGRVVDERYEAALTLWSEPTKRHWPKQPARWKPWAAA